MADSNDTGLTVFGVLEQARQHLQAAYSLVGAVTEDFPAPDEQKDTGQRDLVLQVLHGYENLQETIDLLSPEGYHIDRPLGEIGVRTVQAAAASTQAVSLPAAEQLDAIDQLLLKELSVLDVLRRALYKDEPEASDVARQLYSAISTIRSDLEHVTSRLQGAAATVQP